MITLHHLFNDFEVLVGIKLKFVSLLYIVDSSSSYDDVPFAGHFLVYVGH